MTDFTEEEREEGRGDPSCTLIPTGSKTRAVTQQMKWRCLTSKFSLLLLATVLQHFGRVGALDISLCNGPLGMESGDIPDTDLSASTSFEMGNVGPQNGRVRVERQGGAWCPRNQVNSEAEEWIQIELHSVHVITAVETQGRFGNGQGAEFAEAYVISYFRPELNKWVRYRDITGNEIIKGNINTYLAEKRELNPTIIASRLRILPYSYHRRTVCMRVEIYGCPLRGGLLSYDMEQGSKRGESWTFYDSTYDGVWSGNNLNKGLGILTDGALMSSKDDYVAQRGKGWVGWKNETRNSSNPIEIFFKFDSVREFNSLSIFTSNQFTKEVQVFSEAKVFFSIGGEHFQKDPVVYHHKEDCIFENPRYVSMKLPQRYGRYVKLQLFWAAKWILISEITFDSQPAMGNFTEEVVQNAVTTTTTVTSVAEFPPQSQSDASENISGGSRIPPEVINHMIIGHTPTLHEEWSSVTVVITAVISSFVAIVFVLLLLLTAMVFRQKMKSRGELPGSRNGMPLHYGEHHLEFGYATPEDIRKAKFPTNVEYQVPYHDFPGSSNVMNAVMENSSDSGVHISGKGSLTQYYSCTLVSNPTPASAQDSANEYEYAVPNELGKLLPNQLSPLKSIPNSPATINRSGGRNSAKQRFRELGVTEIPKHQLRMLRKLGNGNFGSVFIGELENGSKGTKNLVAVKQLLKNATEKEKNDFAEEVRLLASLRDDNVTQVYGVCFESEPHGVVLEYLEQGNLKQFLRQNDSSLPSSSKKLSLSNLIHISSQIASGMKYLEAIQIVHRDLATRNCVVGNGLVVKISHFATDTDLYNCDYYRLDGKMPLPIRWMSWESIFKGKYSCKSDIWSFGVTLWEIFSFAEQPYPSMNNQEVIHNIRCLSTFEESDLFEPLSKPHNCPRDVYQLMCDAWSRDEDRRPSFYHIHSFLTRKSLQFTPHFNKAGSSNRPTAAVTVPSGSSSFVEHYMV